MSKELPVEERICGLTVLTDLEVLLRIARKLKMSYPLIDVEAVATLPELDEEEPSVTFELRGEDVAICFELKPEADYPEDAPEHPKEYYLHVEGCLADELQADFLRAAMVAALGASEEAQQVELTYGGDRGEEYLDAYEAYRRIEELMTKLKISLLPPK